jgi:WD40 repeat protein
MALRLALAGNLHAVAAGGHVFVFQYASDDSVSEVTHLVVGRGGVCALAVREPSTVAVATEDRSLLVFNAATGALICSHTLLKRATCICLAEIVAPLNSSAGDGPAATVASPLLVVLAADRNGDVTAASATSSVGKRCIFRHTAAIVTDLVVMPGGAAVLSADREHKIRVSSLPFGKPVLAYCLGHTEYVRCLLPLHAHFAVSGGADGYARLWSVVDGALLASLQLVTTATPSADLLDCVFSLVEDAAAPGTVAALVTNSRAVSVLRVCLPTADKPAELAISETFELAVQPMCAAFSAGALVVGCADGEFRAARGALPSWARLVNARITEVKAGSCTAVCQCASPHQTKVSYFFDRSARETAWRSRKRVAQAT